MKNYLIVGLSLSALLIAQTGPSIANDSDQIRKLGSALNYVAKQAERNAAAPRTRGSKQIDKSNFGKAGPKRTKKFRYQI